MAEIEMPVAGEKESGGKKFAFLADRMGDLSKKRVACSCCCGLACYLALVPFWIIVSWTVIASGENFVGAMPGDFIRRQLQDDIVSALESGKWSKVQSGFESMDAGSNSALLIGDGTGIQWELERGWISLDQEYAIASESKMISSIVIYRVMMDNPSLNLTSSPADFFGAPFPPFLVSSLSPHQPLAFADSWADKNVTLENLLAFTAGFRGIDMGSCALNGGGETSWTDCVDELADLDRDVPGVAYNYGSWYMVIACAMAQKSLGRALNSGAWEQTVKEKLFKPVGIGSPVDYGGLTSDIPESMPLFGQWYWDTREAFPGFAHGMRMSGRQYARVLKSLQFEGLLNGTDFGGQLNGTGGGGLAAFVADRTADIRDWQGDAGGNTGLDIGTWHYAQGAWLACDAASEAADSEGRYGSADGTEANALCGKVPVPHIVHSNGMLPSGALALGTGLLAFRLLTVSLGSK